MGIYTYIQIYIYTYIHIYIYTYIQDQTYHYHIYIIYCICKYGNKYGKHVILVHHAVLYHLWNVCGPKCFSQEHLMLSASGSILVETHVNEMVGVDLSIPFVSVLSVCRQSSARMRGIYHSENLSRLRKLIDSTFFLLQCMKPYLFNEALH